MADSKLCLNCGAVVDASKLAVHRQFHGDLDRLVQVTEDLRAQVKRLEAKLKNNSNG